MPESPIELRELREQVAKAHEELEIQAANVEGLRDLVKELATLLVEESPEDAEWVRSVLASGAGAESEKG